MTGNRYTFLCRMDDAQLYFRMVHIPGIKHWAANCIPRHPAGDPEMLPLPNDTETVTTCGRVQTVASCTTEAFQDSIEDTGILVVASLKYV